MNRRGEEPSPHGDPDVASSQDERAPYLGSWPLLYGVVFLNLLLLIALFTWFTRSFE
jgi:hypothetical protein